MKTIISAIDAGNRLIGYLLGLLLSAMLLCILLQVVVRFILTFLGINVAVPWSEEVARYLMIWIVFLGAAVACRRAQLISLEMVVGALPDWLGQVLRYLALVVCLLFFVLLLDLGLQFVDFGGIERSPVMSISKVWVYWALPVGAFLMIVNTLALILESAVEKCDIRFIGRTEAME